MPICSILPFILNFKSKLHLSPRHLISFSTQCHSPPCHAERHMATASNSKRRGKQLLPRHSPKTSALQGKNVRCGNTSFLSWLLRRRKKKERSWGYPHAVKPIHRPLLHGHLLTSRLNSNSANWILPPLPPSRRTFLRERSASFLPHMRAAVERAEGQEKSWWNVFIQQASSRGEAGGSEGKWEVSVGYGFHGTKPTGKSNWTVLQNTFKSEPSHPKVMRLA